MRVHHLNCATMRPPAARLVTGEPGLLARGTMVCHCLLVEAPGGLVLVDTGFGLGDVERPAATLSRSLRIAFRPRLDREETAARQVERLGFAAADVRHVVLTHLDLDHTGGLRDFPHATVHVSAAEHAAAMAPRTAQERRRYQRLHWAHGPRWATYGAGGERWSGFDGVRQLDGLPPDVLLVPLAGHTRGHSGVAVRTRSGRWLLHGGDAYFHRDEVDPVRPRCPPGLSLFQRVVQVHGPQRLANRRRLRELAGHGEVDVVCAHDAVELARYADA